MVLPKSLTTVTTLSKTIALFLFILLPFAGFYAGYKYREGTHPNFQAIEQIQNSTTAIDSNETSGWKTLSTEYHNAHRISNDSVSVFNINFSFKYPPNYKVLRNSIVTNDPNLGDNVTPVAAGSIAAIGIGSDSSEYDELFEGQETKLGGKEARRIAKDYKQLSSIRYVAYSMPSNEGYKINFEFVCNYVPKNGVNSIKTCDLMASTLKFTQ